MVHILIFMMLNLPKTDKNVLDWTTGPVRFWSCSAAIYQCGLERVCKPP